MKKIAIVTLNGYFNYGNRLQNYALQELLKGFGFEVETIRNETNFNKKVNSGNIRLSIINRIRKKNIKDIYNKFYNKLEKKLYKDKLNNQRTKIFKDFTFKYIRETNYSISEDDIPSDLASRYDYFVVGSDQVWNPNYRKGSPIEFLTFAPPKKRIAYAPSFGVSEIPEEYIKKYSEWLLEIPHISVREEAGAKIIRELTRREAPVVLDPTMVLTKEKWLSISKVPSYKPTKGYLLTYFLGDIPRERMKKLKDIAKNNDLEIVHLAQIRYKKTYLTGPSEFIDYINSASVFCTDSFHGAVFSILLNTPFIVFNREGNGPSMNSRLETLLRTFKLESRLNQNIQSNSQIFDVDFSHIGPILEKERAKSLSYLENSLGVNSK